MKQALQPLWTLGTHPFLLVWWFGLTIFVFFLFIIGNFQKFQDATLILLLHIQTWLSAGGVVLTFIFSLGRWFGPRTQKKVPWRIILIFYLSFFGFLTLGLFVLTMTSGVRA